MFALFPAWVCLVCALPLSAQPSAHRPVFQKGMTFTHGYGSDDNLMSGTSTAALEHLRRVNVEWTALNPFAYQRTVDDAALRFGRDPPDDHLRHGIREARRLGFKVMLKPHVWVRRQSSDHWRGTIGMATEEAWQQWWSHYESFVLHYARIAAEEGVEIFCVGVELTRVARERPEDWRRLIARVREAYPGPLTYAANWWEEYDRVEFWDALDYIGVNAFFPLTEPPDPGLEQPDPTLEQLRAGAVRVADEIEALHQLTGRPVLLTEIGYKSVRGASLRPWEWTRRPEPDLSMEEQALCYQAVLEAFWPRPWFHGMYWWKWHSDLRGGEEQGGFTPHGKPAERVLTEWYQRLRPVPPTPVRPPR
ncbi:MAG: hypothetical protein OXG13_20685 [Gemmatimonadaceae bacterium]|nr:hypothetical protein [Gemmatimonadaceae bacterium]